MLLSWLSNTFGIDIFITTFTPVHTTRAAKLGIVSGTVVVGFFLLLPTSLVVAQLATRLIIRRGGFSLRHPVWPSIAAFLVGDFLLELCTWSSSAITNMEEETASEIWLVFTHAGLFVLVTLGTLFGQSFIPVVITGSISTGKSTVSRLLIETNSERQSTITKTRAARNHRNDRIIDTDAIGHQILLSSAHLRNELGSNGTGTHERYDVSAYDSVYDAILETFGDTSVSNKNILNEDAQIDRRKLGEIIFRDPSKRKMLNRITHPRIIRVLLQQLITGTLFGNGSIVCADVPLLFETGSLRMLFCLTIVVACDPDVQYTRLRKRNADLSEQQCRDRIASQMPMNRKVKYADIVIWNNGTQEDLSQEVERARTEVEKRLYSRITLLHFVVIFGILQCIQNMWKLYYKSLSF